MYDIETARHARERLTFLRDNAVVPTGTSMARYYISPRVRDEKKAVVSHLFLHDEHINNNVSENSEQGTVAEQAKIAVLHLHDLDGAVCVKTSIRRVM